MLLFLLRFTAAIDQPGHQHADDVKHQKDFHGTDGRTGHRQRTADARFNLGEFFIPVAFVILIGSIFVTYKWPALALPLMLLMYIYLFAVIIDIVIMWRKLKKKLIEKFGEQSVAKGMRSGSYAWSRAIQMRRWRLPKPRYQKRGHWPE